MSFVEISHYATRGKYTVGIDDDDGGKWENNRIDLKMKWNRRVIGSVLGCATLVWEYFVACLIQLFKEWLIAIIGRVRGCLLNMSWTWGGGGGILGMCLIMWKISIFYVGFSC